MACFLSRHRERALCREAPHPPQCTGTLPISDLDSGAGVQIDVSIGIDVMQRENPIPFVHFT